MQQREGPELDECDRQRRFVAELRTWTDSARVSASRAWTGRPGKGRTYHRVITPPVPHILQHSERQEDEVAIPDDEVDDFDR